MAGNYPAGVTDNDPYFTDESGDVCEHSAPICAACEDEDARASLAALAELVTRNIEMERQKSEDHG